MHSPADPTGQQIHLTRGDVTAHIAQVGAALRDLTVDGTSIVTPYPQGLQAPFGSGTVLAPWPNRIRDGRWQQADPHGRDYDEQLALTEPKLDNAIHGFLQHAPFVVEQGDGSATLTATIVPQNGYPFAVVAVVVYELVDDGIRVTHRFTNVGADAAPVGVGTHGFFHIEGADPRDLVLTIPARTQFVVDDRLLPQGEEPVEDELREGARLGDVSLDTGYADLDRDASGAAVTTLDGPNGERVSVWQDEHFDYLQIFTTDAYPNQQYAVAIEPMSIPTDAFNSGRALTWLEPGETCELTWGVAYSA
ncbi:MAG TPA: aldose 1-epimerase family protein [Candidatus Microbacterium stercoravium]|uniref:Aldose 1-epimerase family protein n=1 Tax=Candidatus Microbacterium stercoravium TaxID=2838697 RepID=A0A9D2H3U1_9MICO|nr:aldose 1-epimerase family protein [Candidatus Microbacterium stercoravium]